MTFYGAIYWPSPETCLDDAFDAPDGAGDAELCRAIVAGRWGLHPDAWGNHDLLTVLPPRHRQWEPPPAYVPAPVDPKEQAEWEAKHRRRPVEDRPWRPKYKPGPKPKPKPPPWWALPPLPPLREPRTGAIELSCDVCDRSFGPQLDYGRGQREAMAASLRALGAQFGWTHIDGRDRCPKCSPVAPENVGNGAGERQGDKQYTNGG